ncbi:MAG: response regulator transcription factor [Lachnospiraceae bacterium]|nr:response regulator transcription factor [Lachnospiraceae bacterium]
MIHVLVVEDDKELNNAVCRHLGMNGYEVVGTYGAREALDILYSTKIDIILTDVMMPEMDGLSFIETVRKEDSDIPVIFMTALDDMGTKRKGYEIGIDDYITKPIVLDELVLRMEALLRRAKIASSKKLEIGNLILDEEEMSVCLDGEEIPLTIREFRILYKLLSNPKHTFTRSQLMDEYVGIENESGLRTVDVHITNIRSKFSGCDCFEILTVRGMGYKAVTQS